MQPLPRASEAASGPSRGGVICCLAERPVAQIAGRWMARTSADQVETFRAQQRQWPSSAPTDCPNLGLQSRAVSYCTLGPLPVLPRLRLCRLPSSPGPGCAVGSRAELLNVSPNLPPRSWQMEESRWKCCWSLPLVWGRWAQHRAAELHRLQALENSQWRTSLDVHSEGQ